MSEELVIILKFQCNYCKLVLNPNKNSPSDVMFHQKGKCRKVGVKGK